MTLGELLDYADYGTPVYVLKINTTSGFSEPMEVSEALDLKVVRYSVRNQQFRVVVR